MKHSICCISTCYCALNRLPIISIVILLPLCLVYMILSKLLSSAALDCGEKTLRYLIDLLLTCILSKNVAKVLYILTC